MVLLCMCIWMLMNSGGLAREELCIFVRLRLILIMD